MFKWLKDAPVWLLIFAVIFAIAVFLGFNFVYLWLWDILAVAIFGLPELTFWQFFGLRILTNCLFGGIRVGGSGSSDKGDD